MVSVNENCIGCGVCENFAPTVFKVEDAMSHVIKQPENDAEKTQTQEAINSCPTQAIQE